MNVSPQFPLVLNHPRAWRTYLGGALLEELHGKPRQDGHFPEEWIMSVIAARNPGREMFSDEGMARICGCEEVTLKHVLEQNPSAYLGHAHAAKYGAHPGVLVKLIDSSERLTIQVHPDRQTAARLFHTPFGKTECWHILGGRTIGGKKPCVYLGFREGVTPEEWKDCFFTQDIERMLSCLHRFEVETGDTILIEGGVPHAIGAGCFLTEIQEPTDYTIRTERTTPSGFQVADEACHQGLGFETMFDCFHYEGLSREETRRRWFIPAKSTMDSADASVTELLGYQHTDFFSMRRLDVKDRLHLSADQFSALYVLKGSGVLESGAGMLKICAPQQIFVPADTREFVLRAEENELAVLQFFGPQNDAC